MSEQLQDMHLLAERHILQGLKEGGWLKGDVEDMLEQRVAALFMPHGEICTPHSSLLPRTQNPQQAP